MPNVATVESIADRRKIGRPRKNASVRVQLTLTDSLMARLEELKDITHHSNVSEFMRDALILYATVVEGKKEGKRFVMREDGKVDTEIALLV